MLIGARFLQGAGGAFTSAVVLGVIVTMLPEPADRAKAIGIYAFVALAGGSIGLLLGGALGLAVLATLSASHSDGRVDDGIPTKEALTSGYQLAFDVV